jgi:uncharacterized membrane protein
MENDTRSEWRKGMRNILLLTVLLVVPFLVQLALSAIGVLRWHPAVHARWSLGLVFAFTGLGHFFQTGPMSAMLPPWVPARRAIILASGGFEWALAAALLLFPWASWVAAAFLVAIFPSNVYAARARVPFGGHGLGPRYLVPRGALQVLLVVWAIASAGA